MTDTYHRSPAERELKRAGWAACRKCGETKSVSQFAPTRAVCDTCYKIFKDAYTRKYHLIGLRARRVTALRKALTQISDGGGCPLCGEVRHTFDCSIRRLDAELLRLGWGDRTAALEQAKG